jgi:hypothetical protein
MFITSNYLQNYQHNMLCVSTCKVQQLTKFCETDRDPWHWLVSPSILGGCLKGIVSKIKVINSSCNWVALYLELTCLFVSKRYLLHALVRHSSTHITCICCVMEKAYKVVDTNSKIEYHGKLPSLQRFQAGY